MNSLLMNIVVKDNAIAPDMLSNAIGNLPNSFDKKDFQQSLLDAGWQEASDPELVRLLMQALKWRSVMSYDASSRQWQLALDEFDTSDDELLTAAKTLPLLSDNDIIEPMPDTPDQADGTWDRMIENTRLMLSALACLAVVGALITLNASFAWELGREAAQFRIAFVVGLMALDLMRPFLVAMSMHMAANRRYLLAAVSMTVALMLSPVSILSSTAILSASVLLGAEMKTQTLSRDAMLETLRIDYGRKLEQIEHLQLAWQHECDRGGCGPIADILEQKLKDISDDAQSILEESLALTKSAQSQSNILIRLVTTFQMLGLSGNDRPLLLPLFLAISLELAALFGPALLLRRE